MLTIIKLATIVLRIIYIPFRCLKQKNKITMLSRQSNHPSISYIYTKKAIEELDKDIEIVILSKKIEGNIFNKIRYCFHTIKQMYHIATSKIVITDGYCIPISVLKHKEDKIILQMWHALNVIKKFGYLALDKPAGVKKELAEVMCMHKNYTHILSGSRITGEIYQKSFNSNGDILIMGLPYLDYIQNSNQTIVNKMYNKYPQIKNKKNILYAPTFRKHHKVNLDWIVNTIDLEEYNVIVKLHPVDAQGYQETDSRIICDTEFSTYEWLWCVESVITDYSGISVESALLNKKLYFYLYDKERYESEIGLNSNLYDEPISKYVCESNEKLKELLSEEYNYKLLNDYKEKYIEFDVNNCSQQFAKWLIDKIRS